MYVWSVTTCHGLCLPPSRRRVDDAASALARVASCGVCGATSSDSQQSGRARQR